MIILYSVGIKTVDSHNLTLDCPHCHVTEGAGRVDDNRTTLRLFFILPFLWFRNTSVTCLACKKRFGVRGPAARIASLSPEALAPLLSPGLSVIYKFAAIAGLALAIFPFAAPVLSALSLLGTYRARGRWRAVSLIGLVLGVLWSLIFLFVFVMR